MRESPAGEFCILSAITFVVTESFACVGEKKIIPLFSAFSSIGDAIIPFSCYISRNHFKEHHYEKNPPLFVYSELNTICRNCRHDSGQSHV